MQNSFACMFHQGATDCPLFWTVFSRIFIECMALRDRDTVYIWSKVLVGLQPWKIEMVVASRTENKHVYSSVYCLTPEKRIGLIKQAFSFRTAILGYSPIMQPAVCMTFGPLHVTLFELGKRELV